MRVDICRANVLSADEMRMEVIEKHRRGEKQVTAPSSQHPTNHAVHSEVITPVLVEYRSRLRGALLNISVPNHLSNITGPRNTSSVGNLRRHVSDIDVSYGLRSVTPSLPSAYDYSSLVYDDITLENMSGIENMDPCQRMLSFKSSAKDPLNNTFNSYGSSSASNISAETPDPYAHDQLRVFDRVGGSSMFVDPALDSAVHPTSSKPTRKINPAPTRILDAPELVDDYYLNLISWGKDNILAVALGQCVYLWNATNGEIQHLLTLTGDEDFVTSVRWADLPGHTNHLAVGTNEGPVQLWDVVANKKVRSLRGHAARVGSLAWAQHILSSGGRDSVILQHDVRSANHIVSTYAGHTQEVCGLEWNEDGTTLASGGNENYLCIWDAAMSMRRNHNGRALNSSSRETPRLLLTQHQAAVKALAWCPFHRGLLASGGGTADRTIKFWNSNSGALLNSVDTGSQVCSLLWSKHQRELCSSHGFSENQLILWRYPTMSKIQEFKGHTARVSCYFKSQAIEATFIWTFFEPKFNEYFLIFT
jgi:cell division cycle protein 20 (cofactor of APC complex)